LQGCFRKGQLNCALTRHIKENLLPGVHLPAWRADCCGVLYPFFSILLSPMIAAAMSFSSVSVQFQSS